jgi:uncharacterized protein
MPAGFDWMELIVLALALAVSGGLTGILAGLFGVGGGAVSVPILFEVFKLLGVAEAEAMPLAVGTSLAIIVPTSLRSARGHYLRGAVDTGLLRAWGPTIVLGVLLGSAVARFAEPWIFQLVFVLVAGVNAVKLLFGRESWRIAADLPKGLALRAYGMVTGLLSALMGIGGGAIANLIMMLHGRPMIQAVATSAGVGVLISIPGAIGYMLAGWGKAGLPPDAVGFVSLLGFALVVPTTLLTTPLGVRLAHALPRRRLEMLFGLFLVLVSLRFIFAMLA